MKDILARALENPDIEVKYWDSPQAKKEKVVPVSDWERMTETEKRFVRDVLEPQVASGNIATWEFEPQAIRVPGQRYTPDFQVVWKDRDGEGSLIVFYEIKGKAELRSERAASNKIRWTASVFATDIIKFEWWKWNGKSWKSREITPKLGKHRQTK